MQKCTLDRKAHTYTHVTGSHSWTLERRRPDAAAAAVAERAREIGAHWSRLASAATLASVDSERAAAIATPSSSKSHRTEASFKLTRALIYHDACCAKNILTVNGNRALVNSSYVCANDSKCLYNVTRLFNIVSALYFTYMHDNDFYFNESVESKRQDEVNDELNLR
uniref:Uncharacterized protein n=1 Tax=Trichogramma kaykai TaxID=54128 RepID=A0ABD2W7T4_9HYME